MNIIDHTTLEYREGIDDFLNFAFSNMVEGGDNATIRCPCDKCRNLVFKKRCDVKFDLLKSGMYENYTTWDLHGEKINKSSSDSVTNMKNRDEIHSDVSGVNMLEYAFGIPGLHLDGADGNHHGIDYECNEEPKGEAAKFYRLLK